MHELLPSFAAVLFDFDGTLIDSYPGIAASVNYVRAQQGAPPLAIAEVKRHVGRGPDHLLGHTVPGYDRERDIDCYRTHHVTVMRDGTSLLPGAAPVLAVLQRAGKRLGLCSNKPRPFSEQLLEHLGVAVHFETVLGPEDVAQPKPAPDMLLAALTRLDLPADAVLYVGDMTVDIETARGAGLTVWVVPTGSDTRAALEAARPDRILDRLQDLVEPAPTA